MQFIKNLMCMWNDGQKPMVPFGREFRDKYFTNLDPNVTPVNHGSYGLTPTPVFEEFISAMQRDNQFPDEYNKYLEIERYEDALKTLGDFFNCSYKNLAIVENATTGINTILRSLTFEKGDKIIVPSTVYENCGATVEFLSKRYGVVAINADLKYPLSDKEVVAIYRKLIKNHSPKICMFDTVTSTPGVKVPYVELTKLCKEYGVLSVIDGAHAAGLIAVDLSFKPNFFVTNLHKWLFVPKGCCAMYVDEKHFREIQALPIAQFIDQDANLSKEEEGTLLIRKFGLNGTKYHAQLEAIKPALEFRRKEAGGEKAIRDYCYALAIKVGKHMAKEWSTGYLENREGTLTTAMVNVEVPVNSIAAQFDAKNVNLVSPEKWGQFQLFVFRRMMTEDKTYLPLLYHNGKVYTRFSCQIYTSFEDHEFAAKKLHEKISDYFKQYNEPC